MEFSTSDNDNDAWSGGNCAAVRVGANWWNGCGRNNINGKYGREGESGREFMSWWHFGNGNRYNVEIKSITLMFRPTV